MKILGIYGSPRKDGNTDLMLNAFLDGAAGGGAEIERLYVRDLAMSGCLECGQCDETGVCAVKDDMDSVYPMLEKAESIVVATPIFFYGVTGQLKLLIDRSQASYMRKALAGRDGGKNPTGPPRRGFLLSAGATRGKRLFECAVLTIRYFFDALDVVYSGDLCFRQIEGKGAIRLHPTALEECCKAGRDFALHA